MAARETVLTPEGLEDLKSKIEHLRTELLARRPGFGNEALCVGTGRVEPLALLLQELRGGFAIGLRGLDRLLELPLALLDRGRQRLERIPREDEQQDEEDEQRPEHQPGVGRQQIHRLVRLLLLLREEWGEYVEKPAF